MPPEERRGLLHARRRLCALLYTAAAGQVPLESDGRPSGDVPHWQGPSGGCGGRCGAPERAAPGAGRRRRTADVGRGGPRCGRDRGISRRPVRRWRLLRLTVPRRTRTPEHRILSGRKWPVLGGSRFAARTAGSHPRRSRFSGAWPGGDASDAGRPELLSLQGWQAQQSGRPAPDNVCGRLAVVAVLPPRRAVAVSSSVWCTGLHRARIRRSPSSGPSCHALQIHARPFGFLRNVTDRTFLSARTRLRQSRERSIRSTTDIQRVRSVPVGAGRSSTAWPPTSIRREWRRMAGSSRWWPSRGGTAAVHRSLPRVSPLRLRPPTARCCRAVTKPTSFLAFHFRRIPANERQLG